MAVIVKSVEYVELTINSTTAVTAALTAGVDETQCVPFYSYEHDGAVGDDHRDRNPHVDFFDDGGTPTVRAQMRDRQDASDTIVGIFVVEFVAAINVQQVAATTMTDGTTDVSVTVTSVGAATSEAFVLFSYDWSNNIDLDGWNDICCQVRFASTTSVNITRRANDGDCLGTLYIVDCDSTEFVTQHIEIDVTTVTDKTKDSAAFTAVVEADTFCIHTWEASSSTDDLRESSWLGDLKSTTVYRVTRGDGNNGNSTATHSVQIVECSANEWDVQRATSLTKAATSFTDTITAIDQARSIINSQSRNLNTCDAADTGGGVIDGITSIMDFSSTTLVRFRSLAVDSHEVGYEVVQFVLTAAADVYVPVLPQLNYRHTGRFM